MGAAIAGNNVMFVTLEKDTSGNLKYVAKASAKLSLIKTEQAGIRAFFQSVSTFLTANSITHITVRGVTESGLRKGGATAFKILALLQVIDGVDVDVIHPKTMTTWVAKNSTALPSPKYAYLQLALEAAAYTAVKC